MKKNSQDLKVEFILDGGNCDYSNCDRANENVVVISIPGKYLSLCEYHAGILTRRLLKMFNLDPHQLKLKNLGTTQ